MPISEKRAQLHRSVGDAIAERRVVTLGWLAGFLATKGMNNEASRANTMAEAIATQGSASQLAIVTKRDFRALNLDGSLVADPTTGRRGSLTQTNTLIYDASSFPPSFTEDDVRNYYRLEQAKANFRSLSDAEADAIADQVAKGNAQARQIARLLGGNRAFAFVLDQENGTTSVRNGTAVKDSIDDLIDEIVPRPNKGITADDAALQRGFRMDIREGLEEIPLFPHIERVSPNAYRIILFVNSNTLRFFVSRSGEIIVDPEMQDSWNMLYTAILQIGERNGITEPAIKEIIARVSAARCTP